MVFRPRALAGIAVTLWSMIAGADTPPRANELFDEGRVLMESQHYAAACERFERSLELYRGLGTLLWLADCEAQVGRLASAWRLFKEAEAAASARSDARAKVAAQRARELAPQLAFVRVVVPPGARVAGLRVELDGAVLADADLGAALPANRGARSLVARAPGYASWSRPVLVGAAGTVLDVEIPPLVPLAPAASDPSHPDSGAPPSAAWARPVGWGAVALGGAALLAGGAFVLVALSKKSEADRQCGSDNLCDTPEGVSLRDDAIRSANIATVFLVAGGVVAAGGAALLLFPPGRARRGVSISPTGVRLSASW